MRDATAHGGTVPEPGPEDVWVDWQITVRAPDRRDRRELDLVTVTAAGGGPGLQFPAKEGLGLAGALRTAGTIEDGPLVVLVADDRGAVGEGEPDVVLAGLGTEGKNRVGAAVSAEDEVADLEVAVALEAVGGGNEGVVAALFPVPGGHGDGQEALVAAFEGGELGGEEAEVIGGTPGAAGEPNGEVGRVGLGAIGATEPLGEGLDLLDEVVELELGELLAGLGVAEELFDGGQVVARHEVRVSAKRP